MDIHTHIRTCTHTCTDDHAHLRPCFFSSLLSYCWMRSWSALLFHWRFSLHCYQPRSRWPAHKHIQTRALSILCSASLVFLPYVCLFAPLSYLFLSICFSPPFKPFALMLLFLPYVHSVTYTFSCLVILSVITPSLARSVLKPLNTPWSFTRFHHKCTHSCHAHKQTSWWAPVLPVGFHPAVLSFVLTNYVVCALPALFCFALFLTVPPFHVHVSTILLSCCRALRFLPPLYVTYHMSFKCWRCQFHISVSMCLCITVCIIFFPVFAVAFSLLCPCIQLFPYMAYQSCLGGGMSGDCCQLEICINDTVIRVCVCICSPFCGVFSHYCFSLIPSCVHAFIPFILVSHSSFFTFPLWHQVSAHGIQSQLGILSCVVVTAQPEVCIRFGFYISLQGLQLVHVTVS